MHIEIIIPTELAPAEGIRLASGYMQRSTVGTRTQFYKPLTVKDGLSDRNGALDSEAIRRFIGAALPRGSFTLAIYRDEADPTQENVDVTRSDLAFTVFVPDRTYRISS